MATLQFQRTSEYNNKFRDYILYVDGQRIGTIANGETKEFMISPGQHIVVAKIDWCSSPKVAISIADHEKKTLKVGGFKNGRLIMPAAVVTIMLHLLLEIFFDYPYAILVAIPVFLILVYYLSIGKNKYLTLKEI